MLECVFEKLMGELLRFIWVSHDSLELYVYFEKLTTDILT